MKNLIQKILVFAFAMIVTIQVSAGVYNYTICSGTATTIGNVYPTATLYQWNTTPPQYTPTITVMPTANTTYIVNVFVGTNWLLADTFNIVVNPLPVGTITPSQTICAGQTVTLTATGGVSYLWSTGATTPSINVTPSMTTTYSVVITGANGCSVPLNSTVTVNPLPTITVGSNSPVCEGSTLNLTATADPGSSYAWTGPNGFSSNIQNPVITNASSANAGTYYCTATLNGCSSTSASTTVVVNQTPVISSIGSNSPVCSGNSINLNASANSGSSYSWTGPNGFSSNIQNPSIPNASSANAGNYILVVSLNGCTSIADTTNVVVNPVPVITAIGSNSPLCSGNSINLTATANAGSSYSWTGPNGFSSNLQNPTIANATTAHSGNYNCLVSLGGCSTSANTAVIVNETPTISTIGNNGPVCEGSNLSLYAAANAGSSYSWTGPNGFSSNLQNPTIANTTIAHSGNYNLTVNLTGCTATSSTIASVVASPSASVSGNLSICTGTATTLTANGGTSYLWSNGATTQSISVSPTTTTTYSVVVTATGGCSATAFATVVVNPIPTIGFSPNNPTICEGSNITITANGGSTYTWSTGATTASITVNPSSTATYTVSVSNGTGCSDTGNITVTVNPKPIVNLYLPQQSVCVDANPVTLTGGSPVGGTYYGSGVYNGLFYQSTVGIGTYSIGYTITNSYGCSGSASALLVVNPQPTVIFNSIFPNPINNTAAAFQLNTAVPLGGHYWDNDGLVNSNGWINANGIANGIYTIYYDFTDPQTGCSNTAMQTLTVANGGLGIEDEYSSKKITMYPNPVVDYLNIEMEEIPDLVQIIDMTGKCLLNEKVDSKKFALDVSSFSKGIYLLRFTLKSGEMGTAKFVK